MSRRFSRPRLLSMGRRGTLLLLAIVLSVATLVHTLQPQTAGAAQLTPRKVTISTSQSAATGVSYAFTFSWPTATDVEGIVIQFCTTPLGTCTLPNLMAATHTTASPGGDSGFPGGGTNTFAEVTSNTGACSDTASTMYCLNRTQAASATGSGATVTVNGITNPTLIGTYLTVYARISLYDNNAFTGSIVHDGTVAAGITQRLTTTGRVQERLEFCVAAIDDDDATPSSCAGFPSTTSIDLGVIDNTTIAKSPVEPTATNGSNDDYGVAMVNTNASGGVAITYFPEAATSVLSGDTDQLRRFRVLPTDCSATGTSLLDQCFISASSAGENFAAGTERFGLYVACVDGSQGTTTNGSGEGNLSFATNGATINATYSGTDATLVDATPADCQNSEQGTNVKYGFDDSGTPDDLVASNTVVDDEMLKLSFAATAQTTTPTGTYYVITTYIATPTF